VRELAGEVLVLWTTTFLFLSTIIVLLSRAVFLCTHKIPVWRGSVTVDDDLCISFYDYSSSTVSLCKRTGWQGSATLDDDICISFYDYSSSMQSCVPM
jgi:hypothetical protein